MWRLWDNGDITPYIHGASTLPTGNPHHYSLRKAIDHNILGGLSRFQDSLLILLY